MSIEDTLYPFRRLYEEAPAPLKALAGLAVRALPSRLRFGARYADFRREAAEVGEWDAERIEHYQIAAIRESLMAAAKSSFYDARFRQRGVKPESFESLEQLADYPLLEKADLQVHREQMVNAEIPAAERLLITTGGSSGEPVGFYLQKGVSRPKEQAYLEAMWARRGYRPGDRVAVLRAGHGGVWQGDRIADYDATRDWLILSSSHLTEGRIREYVDMLNQFQPRHLHAYPSSALMLVDLMDRAGLKLNFVLESVLCGSEKLTHDARRVLESGLGASVFHWYGHSERVVQAGQGIVDELLYFWPSYGFVEFGPVNEDGLCEVIGTSFHNAVMPLIRYRTGDLVRLAAPQVRREWPWSAVVEVAGREHDFLVSNCGRRVSLTTLNMHDLTFDGMLAVQFVQEQPGQVILCYVTGNGWDSTQTERARMAVMQKLGPGFHLEMRQVVSVKKTKSGKHRWLISAMEEVAIPS